VNKPQSFRIEDLTEPLTFPVEAYICPDYARAERERLWPKVWQHAGRVEEIPNVGDYITYERKTGSRPISMSARTARAS
jgi:hypothetical protein